MKGNFEKKAEDHRKKLEPLKHERQKLRIAAMNERTMLSNAIADNLFKGKTMDLKYTIGKGRIATFTIADGAEEKGAKQRAVKLLKEWFMCRGFVYHGEKRAKDKKTGKYFTFHQFENRTSYV